MYLSQITIIETKPCTSLPGHINCNTTADADMSDILPYLNGSINDALYYPQWNTLTLKKGQVECKLRKDEIDISGASNMTEARELIEWIKDLINDTYEKRSEISPSFVSRATNSSSNRWRHCWKR